MCCRGRGGGPFDVHDLHETTPSVFLLNKIKTKNYYLCVRFATKNIVQYHNVKVKQKKKKKKKFETKLLIHARKCAVYKESKKNAIRMDQCA